MHKEEVEEVPVVYFVVKDDARACLTHPDLYPLSSEGEGYCPWGRGTTRGAGVPPVGTL